MTLICDPGVDDAVALAFLVGSSAAPSEIVAVAGNASLEATARVAAGMAQLLGVTAPVLKGTGARGQAHEEEAFYGPDGLVGLASRLPVAHRPLRDFEPGKLAGDVLVTAPLTAVRAAVDAGAELGRLVWMGGMTPRSTGIRPEFNARLDSAATDAVLTSGRDVWMVPFDVTRQVHLDRDDVLLLAAAGEAGVILSEACARILDRDGRAFPHDAVAALAVLDPAAFEWHPMALRCTPDGTIIADAAERPGTTPRVRVATSVDGQRARREIVGALVGRAAVAGR